MNFQPSPYLELMKLVLTEYYPSIKTEFHQLGQVKDSWKINLIKLFDRLLRTRNFAVVKLKTVWPDNRMNGYDWPANALTMVGINRLSNIEFCVRTIIAERIAGDLVETGVWRGGAVIFMKAVLNELSVSDRKIWAVDSYNGLPHPDKNFQADADNKLYLEKILIATLEEVKNNFNRFGLLDSEIVFVKGLFKDTLPVAPIDKIALLRIDCDMYESTMNVLCNLYCKVTIGGFVIVDDYNAFRECKLAVDDFRQTNGIYETIIEIDKEAVYWRKMKDIHGN
jgi:hypothetical protein